MVKKVKSKKIQRLKIGKFSDKKTKKQNKEKKIFLDNLD